VMNTALDLLNAGQAAMKAGDFAGAEDYLLASYQAYAARRGERRAGVLDPKTIPCVALGHLYRKTGRYEDAIGILERALPNPGAFGELARIFRFLGKAAKKDGDLTSHAEWYRRMFCLANIHATAMALRVPGVPVAVDWGRAMQWLEDIRRQCGTLYAYHWEGREVENDTLLSAADYKAIRAGAGSVAK
jgi:tetratricopeptide (TPR) repeat protein